MSQSYLRLHRHLRLLSVLVVGLWVGLWAIGLSLPATAQEPVASPAPAATAAATVPALRTDALPFYVHVVPLLGILCFLGVAFALSRHKRRINLRMVLVGLALQASFAFVVLKTEVGKRFFDAVNTVIVELLAYTEEGTGFILRSFADGQWHPALRNFVFSVLPTIIFFSALMSVLYHLGVMQLVVRFMAFVMQRAMGTSGAESMSATANIFVGQTEAPLVVKPYVSKMTQSELMAIMTGGFATVAGGVLAAYVGMLKDYFPSIAGHLMAASIMNAPAGLVLAKIMQPEVDVPETLEKREPGEKVAGGVLLTYFFSMKWLVRWVKEIRAEERPHPNVIGAAAGGAADGMSLALNVAAMLLAFIALIATLNGILEGITGLTLDWLLGKALGPVAFLMGVPWEDASAVGALLGTKMVLNEFLAYTNLGEMVRTGSVQLHERSVALATYALLGFANFSSIAIQIGGIGGIAPERRGDLARLGVRAMLAGTLAAYMSACVAGLFI